MHPSHQKLIIPTREGYEFIDPDDILYCEADGNRCKVQTTDTVIKVSRPLKSIEEQLSDDRFFRIHQSFLVNLDQVTKYIRGTGGYLVMTCGHELKVAEARKMDVLRKLRIIEDE